MICKYALLVSLTLAIVMLPVAVCLGQTTRPHPAATAQSRTVAPAAKPAAKKPVTTPVATGAVMATVNGQTLTQPQFDRFVNEKWGRQILDDMVDAALVRQEAAARGVTCDELEIDKRVEAVKKQLGGVESFNEMLKDRGLTQMMYRSDTKTSILLEKLMGLEFAPDDSQIREYYSSHLGDFKSPAKVHLYDLVTASADDAYAARQRIANGEDFSKVAAEVSTDNTWDRGWVTREEIKDALIREVAFGLQQGQISNPLKAGESYHVLYTAELRAERDVTLEQAKPEISAKLKQANAVPPDIYVLKLRRKANVTVAWKPYAYMTQEYAAMRKVKIVVDNKPVKLSAEPVVVNGRMEVAAKAVLQAMGAFVSWQASTRVLGAQVAGGKHVEITVGSSVAKAGERTIDLGAPAQMRNGVVWIAPRAVIEALGGETTWDEYRNTLFVRSPKAVSGNK